MKSLSRNLRLPAALAAITLLAGASVATASNVISEAGGFFTPSFRGTSTSTYFGWSSGTLGVATTTVNGTPTINPAGLTGSSFLTEAGVLDVVASSNNIYSSVSSINSALLTLHVPTLGTVGVSGFTTIIIQGVGAGGFGFPLDTFAFGTIDGIAATYEYAASAAAGNPGQWWAKWELPGNAATYDVPIIGYSAGAGVLSVTSLIVDTYYSPTAFAADSASAVPEASSALLSISAVGLMAFRRNRQQA